MISDIERTPIGPAEIAPPAPSESAGVAGAQPYVAPSGPSLWTILIPTIGQREHLLLRLLDVLMPQVDAAGGAVRVLAWRNNGSPLLGEIRDALVRDSGTEYVSFIDDDDLVPAYYVPAILDALSFRPDHVGFQLEYTTNGVGHEIVDHSLEHGTWKRERHTNRLVRDFTHIDPVRRELAMQGTFVPRRPGRAEDRHWVKQIRPWVITEAYIPRIMYHYLYDETVSAWQDPGAIVPKPGRPEIPSPYFAWHPRSDP